MAESLDGRKFERKATFDMPLPIRRAQREVPNASEDVAELDTSRPPARTMSFALMTKKGNKPQVRERVSDDVVTPTPSFPGASLFSD